MAVSIVTSNAAPGAAATGQSGQNHLVWAPNYSRWWVFYLDSTQSLSARYSSDGSTWSQPTGSPFSLHAAHNSEGRNFAFACKGIGGHDVLHMAAWYGSNHWYSRFWLDFNILAVKNTEAQALALSSGSYNPAGPAVGLASDGRRYDGGFYNNADPCDYAYPDVDSGTSWGGTTSANTDAYSTSQYTTSHAIVDVGGGNVMHVFDSGSNAGNKYAQVLYSVWNGTTWGAAALALSTTVTATLAQNWAVVGRTTSDVHLVSLSDNTSAYVHRRWNGTSWSDGDAIPSFSLGANSGLSMVTDGTSVWLFASDTSKNVKYVQWISGVGWGSWTTVEATRTNTPAYVTACINAAATAIQVAWTEQNGPTNFDIIGSNVSLTSGGATVINSTWKAVNAATYGGDPTNGPFVFDQASTTYQLPGDLTLPKSGFIVTNSGVTLDLNGHTLTYGNSPAYTVVNGGFEAGTLANWTATGVTPTVVAQAAAQHLWGTYCLQYTMGGTIATLTSDAITINSGYSSHTHAATITANGGGYNPDGTTKIAMTLAVIDGTSGTVLGDSNNSTDIGSPGNGYSAVAKFTPGSSTTVKLKLTLTPNAADTCYVDGATLNVSYDHGIIAAHIGASSIPGYANLPSGIQSAINANFGSVSSFTVKNGSITCGTGAPHESVAIFAEYIPGVVVDTVHVTTNATNAVAVDIGNSSGTATVTHCTFDSSTWLVTNRQRICATVSVYTTGGTVSVDHCTFNNSPQSCVYCDSNTGGSIAVSNNTLGVNGVAANCYAIIVSNCVGGTISSNTLTTTQGRGLTFDNFRNTDTGNQNWTITGNSMEVAESGDRENIADNTSRALRIRNNLQNPPSAFHKNLVFSGNTWKSNGGVGSSKTAFGARITLNQGASGHEMDNCGISFTGDTFISILSTTDASYKAHALEVDGMDRGINVQFLSCTFESNDESIGFTGSDGQDTYGATITSPVLKKSTLGASRTYSGLQAGYSIYPTGQCLIANYSLSGTGANANILYEGSGAKDLEIGYLLDITVTHSGSPVAGAAVTVSDKNGLQWYSGTTDGSGLCSGVPLPATMYSSDGSNGQNASPIATSLNPLSVHASSGSLAGTQSVTLSANSSVTVPIGAGGSLLPVSDNFDRSNGAIGAPWIMIGDAVYNVVSNQASNVTGTGPCLAYQDVAASAYNVIVTVKGNLALDYGTGLLLCNDGTNQNYLAVYLYYGGVYVREILGGSLSNSTGVALTPGTADKVRAVVNGSTLNVYYTPAITGIESQVITNWSLNPSTGGTKIGLFAAHSQAEVASGVTLDDWSAQAPGTTVSMSAAGVYATGTVGSIGLVIGTTARVAPIMAMVTGRVC